MAEAVGPPVESTGKVAIAAGSIWNSFTRNAKLLFEDEQQSQPEVEEEKQSSVKVKKRAQPIQEPHSGVSVVQKGLDSITNSLATIGDTFGNVLEEGITLVSSKAADFIAPDAGKEHLPGRRELRLSRKRSSGGGSQEDPAGLSVQLKASRDVAAAMASKANQLQRQLKEKQSELEFANTRCSQLEEENKQLRHSLELQGKIDEDPFIRQQLEALLTEKSRLSKELAIMTRENANLHELLEFAGVSEVSESDEAVGQQNGSMARVPSPSRRTESKIAEDERKPMHTEGQTTAETTESH